MENIIRDVDKQEFKTVYVQKNGSFMYDGAEYFENRYPELEKYREQKIRVMKDGEDGFKYHQAVLCFKLKTDECIDGMISVKEMQHIRLDIRLIRKRAYRKAIALDLGKV